jgi:hypothetical protein
MLRWVAGVRDHESRQVFDGVQGLFAVEPGMEAESNPVSCRRHLGRTFPVFNPNEALSLAPTLDDWLPQGHRRRFVAKKPLMNFWRGVWVPPELVHPGACLCAGWEVLLLEPGAHRLRL